MSKSTEFESMDEVYDPKSRGELNFKLKHIAKVTSDASGNKDDVFNATNVKTINRKKEKHGFDEKEGIKVYEALTNPENYLVFDALNEDQKKTLKTLEMEDWDPYLSLVFSEDQEVNNAN